jgi:hypothetical protein
VIPSSLHRLATFVSRFPMLAIASRSFAVVIFGLRPPTRPRARADARPAFVRSVMSSRSNSASAAKMPKISLPAAVVVFDRRALAGQHAQADLAGGEVMHGIDEVAEISPEPVELPHNKRVALAERLQTRGEAWSVIVLAGCRVAVDVPLEDAGGEQRVPLQVEHLRAVGFRDDASNAGFLTFSQFRQGPLT